MLNKHFRKRRITYFEKIMLIDTNYGFTSDVESRLILDDIEGIEILTRNNINIIHEQIEKNIQMNC